MNHLNDAAALIKELGGYTGIPELVLGETGICTADIEGIRFSFFYNPEWDCLFIQAALGAPGQEAMESLLRINHLWEGTAGGIFGLNPEDGLVYFCYRLNFPLADEPAYDGFMCDLMANIVGAIEAAGDALNTPQAQPGPGAGPAFTPGDAV